MQVELGGPISKGQQSTWHNIKDEPLEGVMPYGRTITGGDATWMNHYRGDAIWYNIKDEPLEGVMSHGTIIRINRLEGVICHMV